MTTMIRTWVPVYFSMDVEFIKPANWDNLNNRKKRLYVLEHGERRGGLCHQCADHFESDYEINDRVYIRDGESDEEVFVDEVKR